MTGAPLKVVAVMHELASRSLFNQDVGNLTDRLAEKRGWVFHNREYPVLDCEFREDGKTPLRLAFLCDNWNEIPPSITLLKPDGSPLQSLTNPTGVFNLSPHPVTGRFFVCMRGSREYHTHFSHVTDLWESIKHLDSFTLGGILTQLWQAWRKGN